MRYCFLLVFILFIAAGVRAQGVTKNGQITSNGSLYVSKNGAVGASEGVDKNGKAQAALAVGSSYQGGKIFYFFVSGDPGYVAGQTHGLIAATADLADAVWGCGGSLMIGSPGFTIGTGSTNTDNIVAGCTTVGIGAELCKSLVLNTYSDWYLPSIDELVVLMNNEAAIGGFTSNIYLSSTENNTGTFNAKNFYYGSDIVNKVQYGGQKINTGHVRPIRTF